MTNFLDADTAMKIMAKLSVEHMENRIMEHNCRSNGGTFIYHTNCCAVDLPLESDGVWAK